MFLGLIAALAAYADNSKKIKPSDLSPVHK